VLRFYRATLNTFRGFSDALHYEKAVQQEMLLLLLALPLALYLAPSAAWYVAMVGVLLVIIAVELLNTAIEKLADHVSPEWRRNIGMIKDFGSAAVFCVLCLAGLVWTTAVAQRFGML
jgi:diacylglycerol kinase (ATP)